MFIYKYLASPPKSFTFRLLSLPLSLPQTYQYPIPNTQHTIPNTNYQIPNTQHRTPLPGTNFGSHSSPFRKVLSFYNFKILRNEY